MSRPTWDPQLYTRYADQRGRPYLDLTNQITTTDPTTVVDLGCGPGTMTALLADRWPRAAVLGIDASAQMISRATAERTRANLEFEVRTIEDWRPEPGSVDVIVANASLQWVPSHVDLLPLWNEALRPGGAIAFQLPPCGSPAQRLFATVATSERWNAELGAIARGSGPWSERTPTRSAEEYLALLSDLGLAATVWETTYLHVLDGQDPVLDWFAGTALLPYFEALDEPDRAAFRAEVAEGLRRAYPKGPHGTVLPFRRIFAVATRGH